MKKIAIFFVVTICFLACNNQKDAPDISGIHVSVDFRRFDQDLFSIDTNNLPSGLNQLQSKYPELTPLFLEYILGLDTGSAVTGVKDFIRMSQPLRDTVNNVFKNTDELKKEFE